MSIWRKNGVNNFAADHFCAIALFALFAQACHAIHIWLFYGSNNYTFKMYMQTKMRSAQKSESEYTEQCVKCGNDVMKIRRTTNAYKLFVPGPIERAHYYYYTLGV